MDLKHLLVDDMIKDGRAKNIGWAVRGTLGTAAGQNGGIRTWENNESLAYQWQTQRVCRDGLHSLSVALDGKRLGQPAEETEVYICWTNPADKGFFLRPMVSGHVSPSSPHHTGSF